MNPPTLPRPIHATPLNRALMLAGVTAGCLLLAACQHQDGAAQSSAIRDPQPAPLERPDPVTSARAALAEFVESEGGAGVPEYREAWVDLDADGTEDVLMLLDDPAWCTAGGCPLLVFHGEADGSYRLVTRADHTRAPIAATGRRSSGWQDLIVGIDDGGAPGSVALQFNGEGYPSDPTLSATLSASPSSATTLLQ